MVDSGLGGFVELAAATALMACRPTPARTTSHPLIFTEEAAVAAACRAHGERARAVGPEAQRAVERHGEHLGVDVKVVITPPCILCMDNH